MHPSGSKCHLQPGSCSNSPLACELEKPNSGQANHIVYRVGRRAYIMTAELRRFCVNSPLLANKEDGCCCCCWRTAIFGIGFGRNSGRLGIQLFFEKRTKNGTEVILKKGSWVGSFADRIRQKLNLSTSVALVGYECRGNLKDNCLSRPSD